MNKYIEKIVMTSVVLLIMTSLIVMVSIVVSIFYKEVLKPEPPVECHDGKLFEVTTRDNIIVYEPTNANCEILR